MTKKKWIALAVMAILGSVVGALLGNAFMGAL